MGNARITVTPLPERPYIAREIEGPHEPALFEYFHPQVIWGRLHVMNEQGLHGLIDLEGREVLPCVYHEIDHHDNYWIIVSRPRDGSPPYLPQTPDWKSHREADLDSGDYLMDRMRHYQPRWYGCLDAEGREILPMREDNIYHLREKAEQILGPPPERELPCREMPDTSEHRGRVEAREGGYGYLDEEGNILLPFKYGAITPVGRRTLLVGREERTLLGFRTVGPERQLYTDSGRLITPGWFSRVVHTGSGILAAHPVETEGVLLYDEEDGSLTPAGYQYFRPTLPEACEYGPDRSLLRCVRRKQLGPGRRPGAAGAADGIPLAPRNPGAAPRPHGAPGGPLVFH